MAETQATAVESEDFTLAGYRDLLAETERRYRTVGFEILDEPEIAAAHGGAYCIVRHDIDISPDLACAMAEIETELGVRATYAILLTGAFYNPFDSRTRAKLLRIAELGHDIGLHFDAAWHGIENETELDAAIRWELAILEKLLPGVPVRMFAFHNTTPFTLSCGERFYGGLRNAYARDLADNLAYVSDSNGHWRFKSWQQTLDEHPSRLQILTHPEWWPAFALSPAERVCAHLEAHVSEVWNGYADHLRENGRENRSGVARAMDLLGRGSAEDRAILQIWLTGHREEAVRRLAQLTGDDGAEIILSAGGLTLGSRDELTVAFEALAEARSASLTA